MPSVDAAAKFHAKCCHSARKPPVFHDAFLLMDGSYSLNRTRLQALKTRFPSWLHIFTSRAAAADGAKRVLLDQRGRGVPPKCSMMSSSSFGTRMSCSRGTPTKKEIP